MQGWCQGRRLQHPWGCSCCAWGGEGPKTGQTPPCQQKPSVLQVCKFLIQLSMDFSSYYNRVHILGVSYMSWAGRLAALQPFLGLDCGCGAAVLDTATLVPAAWCSPTRTHTMG